MCGPCDPVVTLWCLATTALLLALDSLVCVIVWSKRAPAPADKQWLASVADMLQRHGVCCLRVLLSACFSLDAAASAVQQAARSSTGVTSAARRACADPQCYHLNGRMPAMPVRMRCAIASRNLDQNHPYLFTAYGAASSSQCCHLTLLRGLLGCPVQGATGSACVPLVAHISPLDTCRSTWCYEAAGDASRAPDAQ